LTPFGNGYLTQAPAKLILAYCELDRAGRCVTSAKHRRISRRTGGIPKSCLGVFERFVRISKNIQTRLDKLKSKAYFVSDLTNHPTRQADKRTILSTVSVIWRSRI
jgi:hypothetical protein